MDEKEVKEHKRHRSSKFSLFKHKLAGIFKEIVKAPPKPPEEEKIEEVVAQEVISEPEKIVETVEEVDEEELHEKEREKTREMIHEHIVSNLNEAVAHWKETGDVGVHVEAPVPLREKVKSFLSRMKTKSVPISAKLKNCVEEVAEKVSSRLKKVQALGGKVDAEGIVKEEWETVLEKMESVSPPSERDEIEKIYKQLSGE